MSESPSVSALPFVNFGAQVADVPNVMASTNLQNSQAGLVQQQTQGAQISNAQAAMQYQLVRNAVLNTGVPTPESYTSPFEADKSGTAAPQRATAPQSAAPQSAASATGGAPNGVERTEYQAPSGGAAPSGAAAPSTGGAAPSGATAPSGAPDVGMSPADPDALDAAIRKGYADQQNPMGTPQEQAAVMQAANSGNDFLEKRANAMRANGVANRTFQSQQDAIKHVDVLDLVVTSPTPFKTLEAVAKPAAAALKKAFPDDSDADLDNRARHWAAHVESGIIPFTGRTPDRGEDGIYRDPKTGAPYHGVPMQGMSPEKYDDAIDKLSELHDVKNSDNSVSQVPAYKLINPNFTSPFQALQAMNQQRQAQAGMPSHPAFQGTPVDQPGTATETLQRAQAHVDANPHIYTQPGAGAGQGGAQPPVIPGSPWGPGSAAPGGAAPGAAPGSQPGAPPKIDPTNGAIQSGETPQAHTVRAMQDPTFRYQPPPVAQGRSQSQPEKDFQDSISAARKQNYDDAKEATGIASQSLVYLKSAQAIMNAKGVPTGLPGEVRQKLAEITGDPKNKNADYQELAMQLANAAVLNAKSNYGSKMTASEVKLQMTELKPNLKTNDPKTLQDGINELVNNAQYTIDSANRVRSFDGGGVIPRGDPRSFSQWNEKYFPRNQAAGIGNPQPAGQQPSGPVRVTSPDQAQLLPKGTQFITPDGRPMVVR